MNFEFCLQDTRERCEAFWKFLWVVPRTDEKFNEAMDEVDISIIEEATMLSSLKDYAECVKYNLLKEITNSKMNIAAHLILGFPGFTETQYDTLIYAAELAKLGSALNESNICAKILNRTKEDIINERRRLKIEIELNFIVYQCDLVAETIQGYFAALESADSKAENEF